MTCASRAAVLPRPTPEPTLDAGASGAAMPAARDEAASPWRGATAWPVGAIQLIGRWAPSLVFALALLATIGVAASVAGGARERAWYAPVVLGLGVAVSGLLGGIVRIALQARALDVTEFHRTQEVLARHAERLRILHEIDRALLTEEAPEAIAGTVIQPLRALLGVPRAIVNLFDLAANEVEWLAAAGRRHVHVGPGVRYSMRLMGDLDALRRGEAQVIDTQALPPGPAVEALLASGVQVYMVVPMIAGGELIGALSFGGAPGPFPAEQVRIAREAATQLAIVIAQARLRERLKHQAQALACANTELRRSNKELDDFAYIASHDLKEPLRGLHNYATFLLEDYHDALDDEGRFKLATLVRLTQRMEALINSLLYYSRLGRVDLAFGEIDLNTTVASVLESLAIPLQEAGVEIRLPTPLPTLRCDKARIGEIFANLLTNAMKYNDKAEKWIEIGCIDDQAQGHQRAPDGDSTPRPQAPRVFYVRDNGIGIPEKHRETIFRIFKRLHAREKYGGGTGVGLTIVKKIVERHGGDIWVESTSGEGTAFYFTLEKNTYRS